jgi:hypothetical protein
MNAFLPLDTGGIRESEEKEGERRRGSSVPRLRYVKNPDTGNRERWNDRSRWEMTLPRTREY